MDNANKVVLVTGCSSGFGPLIAKTLAAEGHTVVASLRDPRGKNAAAALALEDWARVEKTNLRVVELDVANTASVNDAVGSVLAKEGRIDVAVNNAGVATTHQLEAYSDEAVRRLFDVNVLGPHRVNRAVIPGMRQHRSGLLIQISSEAAAFAIPFHGAYPASKVAVEFLAESYRYELAPFGIDSIIIQPGGFPTSLVAKSLHADDPDRLKDYGPLADLPEKLFAGAAQAFVGPNAPKPQAVADAVKKLIETPPGHRPLRTIVDQMGFAQLVEGIGALSAQADSLKSQILATMGLAEATRLVPGPW